MNLNFYAVVYEGEIYCTHCLPEGITAKSEEVTPIFCGAELEGIPSCCICHTEHEYALEHSKSIEYDLFCVNVEEI